MSDAEHEGQGALTRGSPPAGVWPWPVKHTLRQRLRSSEAKRERTGSLEPLALPNAAAVPGVQYRTCRWPMWGDREKPTHVYCDGPVTRRGCSYCDAHAAIAFVPAKEGK